MASIRRAIPRRQCYHTYAQDVFVNAVVVCGLFYWLYYPSLRNQPLPSDLIVFGEVVVAGGLAEKVRCLECSAVRNALKTVKNGFKCIERNDIKESKALSLIVECIFGQ